MATVSSTDTKSPPRQSKVDVVFKDILREITAKQVEPNRVLPAERDLAVRFGVSRRVVREALGRLKGLGLLSARTKGGTRVTQCTWGKTLAAQIPFVASNEGGLEHLYSYAVSRKVV